MLYEMSIFLVKIKVITQILIYTLRSLRLCVKKQNAEGVSKTSGKTQRK